jgi:hypothetical protein
MLLSSGFAMVSQLLVFWREILTANAASPPVETVLATINPMVDMQNGHIVFLLRRRGFIAEPLLRLSSGITDAASVRIRCP